MNYNIILKKVIKLVRPMTIQRGRSRNSKLAWYCILEVRSNSNNTIPTGKTHHIFLGSWLIKYFFFSLKDRKNIVLKKVNLEAETWIKKLSPPQIFSTFDRLKWNDPIDNLNYYTSEYTSYIFNYIYWDTFYLITDHFWKTIKLMWLL